MSIDLRAESKCPCSFLNIKISENHLASLDTEQSNKEYYEPGTSHLVSETTLFLQAALGRFKMVLACCNRFREEKHFIHNAAIIILVTPVPSSNKNKF